MGFKLFNVVHACEVFVTGVEIDVKVHICRVVTPNKALGLLENCQLDRDILGWLARVSCVQPSSVIIERGLPAQASSMQRVVASH